MIDEQHRHKTELKSEMIIFLFLFFCHIFTVSDPSVNTKIDGSPGVMKGGGRRGHGGEKFKGQLEKEE